MSRIQEILAKAEREGAVRRTPPAPTLVPPAPAAVAFPPTFDGTAALEAQPFAPAIEDERRAAAARTASPVLHPALVSAIAPHSEAAEQYRALRARLMLHEETRPLRAIFVTSPSAGDGKSITAANLALTMAQEFQRHVLLVDGDLHGASVHALFGVERSPGLTDVIAGEAALDEALLSLPELRLTLLTAGRPEPFPTEMLGSAAMRRTLDQLRARYDRIVMDLPAALPLADAGTAAPLADGVLMVVRSGATQRPALDEALAVFDEHKVVGVVLNDAR